MGAWLAVWLWLSIGAVAQEAEAPPGPIVKPIEMLKCQPDAAAPEAKAREAAEALNFSDHEVLARLIFAEVISTGYFAKRCEIASLDEFMEALAWVVMNRVQKYSPQRDDPKADAVFHVIFAPQQFNTTFSAKNANPYARAFLCPLEAQKYLDSAKSKEDPHTLYVKSKEVAARVLAKYQAEGIDKRYARLHHVFFPHSDFGGGGRPSWAKHSDPSKNQGYVKILAAEKACAEFYRR